MSRQYKICIVSHSHLTNNPRVLKEAMLLSAAGYNVSVVTVLVNKSLYNSDREIIRESNINYENCVNLMPGGAGYIRIIFARLKRKVFELLSKYLNFEFPQLLTYELNELYLNANEKNADLYICHNEPGLWVGIKLAKIKKNVAFDFEDWYSRDYLVKGRPVKLLSKLEKAAITNAKYVTTTSKAMAQALANEYGVKEPQVIYNAFSLKEKAGVKFSEKRTNDNVSLYWFSQTIGPGRGIEQIIKSLNLINTSVSLHLRGNVENKFKETLNNSLISRHKIFFYEPVPPGEIVEAMQSYDIGLSLELKYPPSRNLTVTNKILYYMLAGLPILASDTMGQREVYLISEGAVEIIDLNDPEKTASVIESLTNDKQRIKVMRERATIAANKIFNWESQGKAFLSCVEQALI